MQDRGGWELTRRNLLAAAGTAAAAGLMLGAAPVKAFGAQAASQPPSGSDITCPRRPLGRSGIEISVISGNECMSEPALIEAAFAMGINYWHKGGSYLVPAMKKYGREKIYVELCMDATGSVDKDVAGFKERLRDGLEYADFYKMHGGYSPQMAEAFHELKNEGLARRLCASFHDYSDALRALKTGELEAIQVSGCPTAGDDLGAVLRAAGEAGAGVTLMKTMMGGKDGWKGEAFTKAVAPYVEKGLATPQAIVAACLAKAGVTSLVIATGSIDGLTECVKGAIGGASLKAARARPEGSPARKFCAVCGACSGVCPQGVAVREVMRSEMYARGYRETARAARLYASLSGRDARACRGCGHCAKACPYRVASAERIARTAGLFS